MVLLATLRLGLPGSVPEYQTWNQAHLLFSFYVAPCVPLSLYCIWQLGKIIDRYIHTHK